MAATKEAAIKRKIRAILDEFEAYYAMPIGTGYGNSGVPDFLVCCNGRFIGIEAKAGANKPTALQQHNIQKIFDAGGYALVINEDNLHVLQELLEWTMKKA
jgi:Holliday junction resolvase